MTAGDWHGARRDRPVLPPVADQDDAFFRVAGRYDLQPIVSDYRESNADEGNKRREKIEDFSRRDRLAKYFAIRLFSSCNGKRGRVAFPHNNFCRPDHVFSID